MAGYRVRPLSLAGAFLPLGLEHSVNTRFLFEVEGVEIGIFKAVSGLELTVKTVEIVEGGQNGFTHKVPGRMDWPNIVFRRGVMQGDALFDWVKDSSGSHFRKNGDKVERQWASIIAIDTLGVPLRAWTLRDAYAVKWKGPEFGVDSTGKTLEEELEIAHHGFSAKTFPPVPL